MTIKMKKRSGFNSIPTLPRNFSDQWTAFSHMANHYRKIINVKPRINTCISQQSQATSKPSFSKVPNKNTGGSMRPRTSDGIRNDNLKLRRTSIASRSNSVDYEYFSTNDRADFSKESCKAGSSLYGFLSDPSNDKNSETDLQVEGPKLAVSSISVDEKIQRFLDHIRAQESQYKLNAERCQSAGNGNRIPSRSSKVRLNVKQDVNHTSIPRRNGIQSRIEKLSVEFDHLYEEVKEARTDLPIPKSGSLRLTKQKRNVNISTYVRLAEELRDSQAAQYTSVADHLITKTEAKQNSNNKESSLKNQYNWSGMSSTMGPRSVSVGTIQSSDELIEESLLDCSTPPFREIRMDREDLTADWLKAKVEKGVVRINHAYFHLAPGTSTSSTSSFGIHHLNKDSSRDSAYGFSSGESRITTRESTPENKSVRKSCSEPHSSKYKSTLSTVASSINQDNSNQSPVNSSGHSSCSEKSTFDDFHHSNLSEAEDDLQLEEKYYQFLTKVTDDIVARGTYTNKGIKRIFNSHIVKNSTNLEMNKMLRLLDQLRIDMGVPKDDSLNQLDLGYGSVNYSTKPYFSKETYGTTTTEVPGASIECKSFNIECVSIVE